MLKIAITVCATAKYTYAMSAQARRIQSACLPYKDHEIHIIFATDSESEFERISSLYAELIPFAKIHKIVKPFVDGKENYKPHAQLVIGQMRTACFDKARMLDVNYCWSLDSDVLPSANSLKCSIEMVEFDDGYYSIAACPYPSQGGGGWLGGRGTVFNPILQDWYEEERNVPEDLKKQMEELKKEMEAVQLLHKKAVETGQGDHKKFMEDQERIGKSMQGITEKIRACPPKGNVFAMNALGWKRRGWFDQAYPATGKGAIVPIDWCGYGNTLMNRKALAVSHFDGYDGKGTEDLYTIWCRWYQNGLRICCIPHCPADHVIRNPGKENYYIQMQGYHETEGECVGHLRIRPRAFYSFDAGEQFDEKNDGVLVQKKTDEQKKLEEQAKAEDAKKEDPKPKVDADKLVEEALKAAKKK
jgi:hypothetical protein